MTTSTLFIVLFSFLAISTRATETEGPNRYCEGARLEPSQFGDTPTKCCDDRGKCNKFIGPGQTKYGLTNRDPTWPRRLCSCDKKLYDCVMGGKSPFAQGWSILNAFRHMTCFRRKSCAGSCSRIRNVVEYEFVNFLDIIRGVAMPEVMDRKTAREMAHLSDKIVISSK